MSFGHFPGGARHCVDVDHCVDVRGGGHQRTSVVVGLCHYVLITHIPYVHTAKPVMRHPGESFHANGDALLPVRYASVSPSFWRWERITRPHRLSMGLVGGTFLAARQTKTDRDPKEGITVREVTPPV